MKKAIFFLSLILFSLISRAQIITVQTSPQTISTQIPGYSEVSFINSLIIPYTPPTLSSEPTPIDGDTTTENDDIYDYGSILPVNISMVDGNLTNTSLGTVWTLRINVTNALNVGLIMSQFNLSPSAEMYIFNDAKTALKSGIKKEHFTISDTISISSVTGDAVTIYIIEINNFSAFQSTILIGSLIAGYRPLEDVGDDESGASLRAPTIDCIPDILCYPQHMEAARAIARFSIPVSIDKIGNCTCTLINNEQNNGRAFVLTAFHCLDRDKNNTIDANEIAAVRSSSFQFQFWKSGCNTGTISNGIEFTGARFLAASRISDMALLEIINPPGIGDLVNYAGWSRQTTPSDDEQSYIIHHPQGQDMRHTQTRIVKNYFLNSSNYFQAYYSSGVVYRGSSGSPLFNENSQVIGQLKAGWTSCNFTDYSDRYGKISSSWDGEGDNNSRLKNWLSPNQNLQYITPLNLTDIHITGPNSIVCTNSAQYTTFAGLLDVTYSWSVTNSLQILSGQGTAYLTVARVQNSNINSGTITLTLRSPTKGRTRVLVINKNVAIANSTWPDMTISGPATVSCGQIVNYRVADVQGASYQWNYPSDWVYDYGMGTNSIVLEIPYNSPSSSGTVRLLAYNACGSNLSTLFIDNTCRGYYVMSPNPTSTSLTVSAKPKSLNGENSDKIIEEVNIYDQTGNLKTHQKFGKARSVNLDVTSLKPGVYFVEIVEGALKERQKLIIAR